MTKLKSQTWFQRPRISRLANVLYPQLADEPTRREMAALAANEKKKPPQVSDDARRGCLSPMTFAEQQRAAAAKQNEFGEPAWCSAQNEGD